MIEELNFIYMTWLSEFQKNNNRKTSLNQNLYKVIQKLFAKAEW